MFILLLHIPLTLYIYNRMTWREDILYFGMVNSVHAVCAHIPKKINELEQFGKEESENLLAMVQLWVEAARKLLLEVTAAKGPTSY